MGLFPLPKGALGGAILRFSFLNQRQRMGVSTLAGSVIIILRPGFFFGLVSISSEPDSIGCELVDSEGKVR
jgi:hypothetical protein